jgi:hypothetical protein
MGSHAPDAVEPHQLGFCIVFLVYSPPYPGHTYNARCGRKLQVALNPTVKVQGIAKIEMDLHFIRSFLILVFLEDTSGSSITTQQLDFVIYVKFVIFKHNNFVSKYFSREN